LGKTYIFLTWIGTVALAPLLGLAIGLLFGDASTRSFELAFCATLLVFGLVFSLPALIVYLIVFSWIRRKMVDSKSTQLIFMFIAIGLINISFWILGGYAAPYLCVAYVISHILSTMLVWRRHPIL
jgi:Sec-independent protein secretion pathway component TatC